MNSLEAIFTGWLDASGRAACLILLVMGMRRLGRGRISARLMHYVWLAVALRLLVPVSLPAWWSPFNLASWLLVPRDAPPPAVPVVPAPLAATPSTVTDARDPTGRDDDFSWTAFSPVTWAASAWAGGAALLLLARVWACARLARKLRQASAVSGPEAAASLADFARLADTGRVKVLITDAIGAPALHGIFRPRILFPPRFLELLSPAEIRLTVAHELGHVRRRDLLVDAIIHFALVIHWFNPLVWLAARLAREDCELACDESVLRNVTEGERAGYGAALLRIARLTTGATPPRFTLGVITSGSPIKRRIEMIIASKTFSFTGTLLGGAVAAALVTFSFTSAITAQTALPDAPAAVAPPAVSSGGSDQPDIVYNPSVDRLDVLFPTGIVATVADRAISVADIRGYIAPLIPRLRETSRTQEEFNGRLARLQNSTVKDLVARTLLIRQFHDQREGGEPRRIAAEHIDTYMADYIAQQFDGDRSRFLAQLKENGRTIRDYRQQAEEDIIYNYMRGQERKMTGVANRGTPVREERPVRLRIVQLTRSAGETDAPLLARANAILDRFRHGETFELLARAFDQSGRREQGGDWGWVGDADISPRFRDAVLTLKKGEVSAPILAPEGCFLVYADDRR